MNGFETVLTPRVAGELESVTLARRIGTREYGEQARRLNKYETVSLPEHVAAATA